MKIKLEPATRREIAKVLSCRSMYDEKAIDKFIELIGSVDLAIKAIEIAPALAVDLETAVKALRPENQKKYGLKDGEFTGCP